jgi:hypothetical protein
MLALTAVMVIEKTSRWGARLVAPAGVALLVAGAVLVVLLLTGMVRQRIGRRRADPWRPSAQSSSASSDAARAAPSDSTGR